MRIVYFIDHLRPDGTQRALYELVSGLARRGHQQTVVCLNDSADQEVVGSMVAARVDVRVIGRRALASGYGLLGLWLWLRHQRPDAAVTMLLFSDIFGRALARMAGVPRIIAALRARNVNYTWWQRAAVRFTMRWAHRTVVNSTSLREYAVAAEGARQSHTVYIPNGIDLGRFARPADSGELRAQLGVGSRQILIGTVGRLTHQKGFDVLLEALTQLNRSDIELVIIGVGEDEARLRAQAARLGVARRVHFMGYRRNVPNLLGALDLYVHPARFEGMSNAIMEAMAAGCPIVASAVDGARDQLSDGVHGRLVAPDNAAALAAAIGELLTQPATARRYGDAARRRAAEQFSLTAMVDSWERLLATSPAPARQGWQRRNG